MVRQFVGPQQRVEPQTIEVAHDHLSPLLSRRCGIGLRHGQGEATGPGVADDQRLFHANLLVWSGPGLRT
ncbi:hypothetical protein D3C71_1097130 [compost metagenome]